MSDSLRVVMAQIDLLVGDVAGNTRRVIEAAERARDEFDAQLVVFPELALTGYPPEDLLLRPGLQVHVLEGLERIRRDVRGIHVIVGHPQHARGGLYNAASVIHEGRILATVRKQHLPNYSVFDEKRYFVPGEGAGVVEIAGVRIGLTICEDIWTPGPARQAREAGAELIVNINASPFHAGKGAEREDVVRDRVQETNLPVLYLNLVGGQDELVFDGQSFVMDSKGEVVRRLPLVEAGLFPVDFARRHGAICPLPGEICERPPMEEKIYRVLVLGVRDYVRKNGFRGAVLGLSGGIDSALTLAIAVDALGAGQVEAVMMPSRYTAEMSVEDARAEAERLGVAYRVIPIERPFQAFLEVLKDEFAGYEADVTEENIQARCRGVILMAISNKTGRILLTTGNKSEVAVGYTTLYGDMAGGFAPIKDVPKTLVYRLAEFVNREREIIPRRVLERPPSAELAPGQTDQDSLPPYPLLDAILERYVEQDRSIEEIIAEGFDAETVRRVAWMVDRNEYKRRQAPPGVRITRRAFGRDRRYPITSGYLETQLKGLE
ncbi:NAD+ synthase [Thiohalobacter sp. IOR34]|uniref:NAD+ synthase n=1 Tax=Thiohalobacter sp. IOR34 TaxID=3057176 RepID=UPI0025B21E11|nr:NAD+ synthase [Thiohalobacter sp. IOR34]WJW74926.1 NAD+ synthase [Thiohalobacter sp. IOR34]